MPRIGDTEQAVVLRTDFSDEACWRSVRAEVLAETVDGFRAYVDVIEDPAFDGLDTDEVLAAVDDDYRWGYLVVGDRVTMTEAEHPFLVLDLLHERGRSFRALPGGDSVDRKQPVDREHGLLGIRRLGWPRRRLSRVRVADSPYAAAATITPASGRGTRSGSSASTSNGG